MTSVLLSQEQKVRNMLYFLQKEAMDELAKSGLSRTKRKNIKSEEHAESKHMDRFDFESTNRRKFDNYVLVMEGRDLVKSLMMPTLAQSQPKFQNGESVIQWWASWMQTAKEAPKSYNKSNRPAWFKGEICNLLG